jgi:hypothetical protein
VTCHRCSAAPNITDSAALERSLTAIEAFDQFAMQGVPHDQRRGDAEGLSQGRAASHRVGRFRDKVAVWQRLPIAPTRYRDAFVAAWQGLCLRPSGHGYRWSSAETAALAGLPVATHLPLMANSDHANFAAHGIPALRLIAGFNAPDSNLRLLLTAADTRDRTNSIRR